MKSEDLMARTLSYEDLDVAMAKLFREISVHGETETVPTKDAYGRIAAEDIMAPSDLPLLSISHVDGYAVNSLDIPQRTSPSHPVELKVAGKVGPGVVPKEEIRRGESSKVATGGYVPRGSDAVVMKERIIEKGDSILLSSPVKSGEEVIEAGSDVKKGEVIVRKGSMIRAQEIGLLATLRISEAKVRKKPVVSIMAVGSELTDSIEDLGEGKVVNSHSLVISRLIEEAGGIPLVMGIVPDDASKIMEALEQCLSKASLVVTIGGSSVGEADLVSRAIDSLGRPGVLVHGLKLQPGRVAGFGVVNGKPVFILPGLIQSTVNAYVFLVYPTLQHLLGREPKPYSWTLHAELTDELIFRKYPDFKKVNWAKLLRSEGSWKAKPLFGDSPMMNVIARADGYILTQAGVYIVPKGSHVKVHLLPGLSEGPAFGE